MSKFEIVMPRMGEGIIEATIIRWLKNEGDKVALDEPILEIATDKVDSEIVASGDGILTKQLYHEGDIVAVGKLVAIISTDETIEIIESDTIKTNDTCDTEGCNSHHPDFENNVNIADETGTERSSRFFSPLVKNIARIENISMVELEQIIGSGSENRITKTDLDKYILSKKSTPETNSQPLKVAETLSQTTHIQPAAIKSNTEDTIVEMDRIRKLIADHMVMSIHTSAHVTSIIEVNMSKVVKWRDKIKDDFLKREGQKITFTPIFFNLVAKAIKEHPGVNASVDGNKIIYRKNINIGMATVLPNGNLIVPVIKDADQKNLLGLTKTINDLASRARTSKLQPDEIQGGTFSITNLGSFDTVIGTPIINQPQVAILAIGAIRKQPIVIESEYGDSIGIAPMMYLSLSYDHRVVDGGMGGMFIKRVKELLENFDDNMAI
jgi:2-oxoglutarate dehydrogenase E2 component (dihydrolipoamide succinyltransferase)